MDKEPKQIDPPAKVASTYLSRVGEWRVPVLVGVVQAPTLRADGTILQEPGYDAASRLIFEPGDTVFPRIAESPSLGDAYAALETLKRPFRDFPFADSASKSVVLAAVLTALIRASLRAAPMFAMDAPTAGSGKSLIAETIGMIAAGHLPAMMSQGKSAEEDLKSLSSVLIAGDRLIVIDNCERQVSGDFLCSMLTQELVQARVLGKSEMIKLPQKAVVIATGNNLTLAGDITRRALICRLDAKVERPDQEQFDFDPRQEAAKNRAALVVAGLTILRAYIAAGRPTNLPKLGSFEDWNVVREALVWVGCADPAKTRERLLESDPEREQLAEILRLWYAVNGEKEVCLADIRPDETVAPVGLEQIEDDRKQRDLAAVLTSLSRRHVFNARSIGRALAKHVDRIVGGLVLRARLDSSGTKLYRVEKVADDERTPEPPPQLDVPF